MKNPLDIKSIMSEALARLAKKYEVQPVDVQVRIFLNPESQLICYQLFVKDSPVVNPDREDGYLSFNRDILNTKVDLLNREVLLNQLVMPPALEKLSAETQASPFDLNIMVGTTNNDSCNAYLYLYKGTEGVRQLFIEKDF